MFIIGETILRVIFSKIPNLIKVLRLRQVSKSWGDLIEEIFEEKNSWKQLCGNNYINPWVYNIIEIIFQNKIKDWARPLRPKSWKKIYIFYNKWNFSMRSTYLHFSSGLKEIQSLSEKISTIDIHDVNIAITYDQMKIVIFEGAVANQSISKDACKLSHLYDVKRKLKKIIKIKFWYTSFKQLILVVQLFHKLTKNSTLKYFDVSTKQKIKNPFRSQTNVQNFTCASHRLFIATSETIYECKWEENKLAIGHTIFEINTILDRNEMRQIKILEMCVKSNFKVDKLTVLIKVAANTIRVITLVLPRNDKGRFKKVDCDKDIMIKHDDSLYYIPMPGIVFVIDASEMMINLQWPLLEMQWEEDDRESRIVHLKLSEVLDLSRESDQRRDSRYSQSWSSSSSSSVGGFRDNPLVNFKSTYRLLRSGKLKISSIFLLCNILILGLQSGDLEIYFLENIKTLTSTDFYLNPRKVINVTEDPIININLIQQRKNVFNIIVTTPKAIHVEEFIPTEDMNLGLFSASTSFSM